MAVCYPYKNYHYCETSSGGKAGKGHNKTASIQVRKNDLVLKTFRYSTTKSAGHKEAVAKAKAFIDCLAEDNSLAKTPWRVNEKSYKGHSENRREKDAGKPWAGSILDANGKVIYAGPFSFWALKGRENAIAMAAAGEMLELLEELVDEGLIQCSDSEGCGHTCPSCRAIRIINKARGLKV